jgi:acetyl-CoA acetyltransferase family protein
MYMGSLSDQRSQDLAASSMKEAVIRAGIDSSKLDVCIFSEAKESSFPANIGRHGWLLAGLDDQRTAGFTLNSLCAGAIQTMIHGFSKIVAGEYDGVLVGGIETNSQAQYYLTDVRYGISKEKLAFKDSKIEVEINAQPVELYGELRSADLADIIAANYGLSRAILDDYALSSKNKAAKAAQNGLFKEAIAPIVKKVKKKDVSIEADEGIQFTTIEKLMSLPPINEHGSATLGNTPLLADGSASLIMMSKEKAKELGCQPMGKMKGFGIASGNPKLLEITSLKSIERALKSAGISIEDLDFIDIHEPSAAYSVALADKLDFKASKKINVDGGSLAFGHAGAATGGIMATNMLYRLQRTGARYGLVNVGALGGQSLSVVIER